MSNIFLQKNKKINKVINLKENKEKMGYIRHFPPTSKEWNNSIYVYNKTKVKSLPAYDKLSTKLIKSYFNMYSKEREDTRSRRLRVRLKRLSINRVFMSKAELKHTNDNITITIYIYNGQLRYYINKLKSIYMPNELDIKEKMGEVEKPYIKKRAFKRKIRSVLLKSIETLKKVNNEKRLLSSVTEWEKTNVNLDDQVMHYGNFVKNFVKIFFQKERQIIYYKRLLFLNLAKFEDTLLLPLKAIISKIYNKRVNFNLVNLKYLHLNSDILSEFIVAKLKKRKNRLLRVLRHCLNIVPNTPEIHGKGKFNTINKSLNPFSNYNTKKYKDLLDELLNNMFKQEKTEDYIKTRIFDVIKHKSINGIRLEASGRLTRRFTASRSLSKVRYKGSLKNIDSSYSGLSTVMLRGQVKSNIQFSKKASKTRIGSFGLKGWISSR